MAGAHDDDAVCVISHAMCMPSIPPPLERLLTTCVLEAKFYCCTPNANAAKVVVAVASSVENDD